MGSIFKLDTINLLPITHKDIVTETIKEPELKRLYENLRVGNSLVDTPYQRYQDELSLDHGCITRGLRILIPTKLQKIIMESLHQGHIGIVRMKALARSYVWWINIDRDIDNLVKGCSACMENQSEPHKDKSHFWYFPSGPWQRIHLDFAGPFLNNYFLLLVDAHSKWLEVFPMSSMTSSNTIGKLRETFARFGLPLTVVTDNGPTFISTEFENFLKSNGIKHKLCAPYHPSSNGQVERYVRTVKNALKKTIHEPGTINCKLSNFLMQYRKTPNATTNISPCYLLLNRDIRTKMDLLKPNTVEEMREKQTTGFHSNLRQFHEGKLVSVRTYNDKARKWKIGRIIRCEGDVNYIIKVDSEIWKRHVDQIRTLNENKELGENSNYQTSKPDNNKERIYPVSRKISTIPSCSNGTEILQYRQNQEPEVERPLTEEPRLAEEQRENQNQEMDVGNNGLQEYEQSNSPTLTSGILTTLSDALVPEVPSTSSRNPISVQEKRKSQRSRIPTKRLIEDIII